jgi:hypothetical protein
MNGHCNVAREEDSTSAGFLTKQRGLYKKGQLAQERFRELDELGVDWNPSDTKWETNFVKLKAFKLRIGNTRVPHDWKEDPSLGAWAYVQRVLRRDGKLSKDRIRRLNEIRFDWTIE